MSRVLGQPAMARWFSMSTVPGREGCLGSCHSIPVLRLSAPDVGYGGHDFPRHTEAAVDVVSCDVVCDEPEEWGQCVGVAASTRAEELRDSLDLAAQIEAGDGAT